MSFGHCKDCRWWGLRDNPASIDGPWHKCNGAPINANFCACEAMIQGFSFLSEDHFAGSCVCEDDTFKPIPEDRLTVLKRGGREAEGIVDVLTGPDFGCVHFEPKGIT